MKKRKGVRAVCQSNSCCMPPDKLRHEPKDCTREQIAECHPESAGHPCEEEKQKEEKKKE